ncbi:hypothetical protein [Enterocloster citroniae]|uniref:Histidine kinase n=2 Tax=Enterocloster citroniae TaxID=358743 RepID=A0ABV2G623_9FIRM|nr:hypothetical protein [Enterocloster citroniae]KMW09506.1 hypothetical protein HMPREF9470_05654 [[Clostridium] citroniae WAL-19142]
MNFELIDNLFQVSILAAVSFASIILTIRYQERRFMILAFAYASFLMGTLYFVLYLAIIGNIPQVFYVSEISWLASYLFFLSLQILRTKNMIIYFSWSSAVAAFVIAVLVMYVGMLGPSRFVSGAFAVTMAAHTYLTSFHLLKTKPLPKVDMCFLLCIILQMLLYIVSCFMPDFTHFNLYFAVDIILTIMLAVLLPLTYREVTRQ